MAKKVNMPKFKQAIFHGVYEISVALLLVRATSTTSH